MLPNLLANLSRSIVLHFDTRRQGLKMHIEGIPRDPREVNNMFELRWQGPQVLESSGTERIQLRIQLLTYGKVTNNLYEIDNVLQILHDALTDILVVDSNTNELFCLRRDSEKPVRVTKMGQLDPSLPMTQALVEAWYTTFT